MASVPKYFFVNDRYKVRFVGWRDAFEVSSNLVPSLFL